MSTKKHKVDSVKRKLFKYSPHKITLALDAIRNGMPVATASRDFQVPRTTLRHKISGKAPETSGHVELQAVLGSKIEAELVIWIKDCARAGFPVNKEGLLDSVKKIVEKGNMKTPFINNRPSRSWFEGFMARHPDLSHKQAEYINKARASITEEKIRNWFRKISTLLGEENLKILQSPERVWNCDETAFFLAPKGSLVLAEKGQHVYDTSKNSDKDNITTLFTVNAVGEYAPPLTIYRYKRMSSEITNNAPDGWGVGKTDKGWMTGESFYEYVANIFIPYLHEKMIELPIILFLDGHKSHLTMHLSELCRENGIIVVALVPNTTHMLQPLDVAVFYPLKQNWRQLVKKWRIENDGQEITKFNLPSALHNLLLNNKTNFSNNVKAGFQTCGLYPFGADYVNFKRIIKHTNTTVSVESTIEPTISETYYITYLERKIDPNLLTQFHITFDSGKDWNGIVEASMLYDTWLAFKNDITTLARANDSTNNSDRQNNSPSLLDTSWNIVGIDEHSGDSNSRKPLVQMNTTEESGTFSTHPVTNGQVSPCTSYQKYTQKENKSLNPQTQNEDKTPDPSLLKNKATEVPSTSNTYPIIGDQLSRCQEITVAAKTITSNETQSNTILNSQLVTQTARDLVKSCVLYPGKEVPKNTRKAIYVPSVLTSDKWRDIMKAAEKEKTQKKGKKNSKAEKIKTQKKTESEEILSSEEDGEVIYAESDDSYDTSESDLPFSRFKSNSLNNEVCVQNLKPGSYVIVIYEGEYFPGKIEKKDGSLFEISTMVLSTSNTFRWPERTDKIWYRIKDIVEIISSPVKQNNRGFFKVPEMDKFLPNIYT